MQFIDSVHLYLSQVNIDNIMQEKNILAWLKRILITESCKNHAGQHHSQPGNQKSELRQKDMKREMEKMKTKDLEATLEMIGYK